MQRSAASITDRSGGCSGHALSIYGRLACGRDRHAGSPGRRRSISRVRSVLARGAGIAGKPAGTVGGSSGVQAPPRELVPYDGGYPPGTIVVSTQERRLYYVLPGNLAIRYCVGVGRPGFTWTGIRTVAMKREWPSWQPPREMLRRRPDLPRFLQGGPDNPLGARAMYLGGTLYRIHGSNEPNTIGQAVSSGCIRMSNDDVVDLYDRVIAHANAPGRDRLTNRIRLVRAVNGVERAAEMASGPAPPSRDCRGRPAGPRGKWGAGAASPTARPPKPPLFFFFFFPGEAGPADADAIADRQIARRHIMSRLPASRQRSSQAGSRRHKGRVRAARPRDA